VTASPAWLRRNRPYRHDRPSPTDRWYLGRPSRLRTSAEARRTVVSFWKWVGKVTAALVRTIGLAEQSS
jgi:hypothetical protein